jgi:hypothetical protein
MKQILVKTGNLSHIILIFLTFPVLFRVIQINCIYIFRSANIYPICILLLLRSERPLICGLYLIKKEVRRIVMDLNHDKKHYLYILL